ncbi:MAG TPA: hypothetical protein VMR79_03035 [Verrucomicrobiae bacterium]|nr:hypothetical protein [Verrucomicrobiae bacterium]
MRDGPPGAPVVAALLAVTAAGTAAYWIAFFAAGNALHSSETDGYVAFEHAFPAADTWMASAAITAAIGLVRRRPWAVLAGVATGSALIFLGLLDVLFNLEQGLYARPSAAMAVEAVINLFCLTAGPFLVVYFWRQRDRLGSR